MTFIKRLSYTLQKAFLISTGIVSLGTACAVSVSLLSHFFGFLSDTDNATAK